MKNSQKTYEKLIEDVSDLSGPDADIDRRIAQFFQNKPYTGSVDAALTLFRDHANDIINISRRTQPEMGGRMWSCTARGETGTEHSHGQRTLELALIVAALKTRRICWPSFNHR